MAYDVFISHSSKDFEIATAACKALEKAGIICWIAPRDILPGEKYRREINRGISKSRVVLLVFSKNSNESEEVEEEIDLARAKRIKIFPWRLEDIQASESLEGLMLGRQQITVQSPPAESDIENLVAAVKHYLPQTETAASEPIPSSAPVISAPFAAALLVETQSEEPSKAEDDAPYGGAKMNREMFLAQCSEADRDFYARVLDYCEENRRRVFIEWGGKGFSLKDRDKRPLIWMFPTQDRQMIQLRTASFTKRENNRVTDILRDNHVSGLSWKPRDLSVEQLLGIVALLCKSPAPVDAASAVTDAMESPIAAPLTPPTADEKIAQIVSETFDQVEDDEQIEDEETASTRSADETSATPDENMDRSSFLARCSSEDRAYFERVFDYCEAHDQQINLDWHLDTVDVSSLSAGKLFRFYCNKAKRANVQIILTGHTASKAAEITKALQLAELQPKTEWHTTSWSATELDIESMLRLIAVFCEVKEAEEKATSSSAASQEVEAEIDTGRKITRAEFLSQCDEKDGAFFSRVLDYCDANRQKIIIDWGGKGFSLKDRNARPLIWMFPTRGSQWTIQVRTLKFTSREVNQVRDILLDLGISGNSWRPMDLPPEKMLDIIALLCKTQPVASL